MLKFLMVCLMVYALGLVNSAPAPQLPPDLLKLMTLPGPAPLPALPPLPGASPPLLPIGPSSQLNQLPTANLPAVNNLKDLFTLLSLLNALKQLS